MDGPVPGTPSLLRAINDRAALRALLDRGPLTRPEIGALTGLSKPTASQLLARLQEAGLVVLDGVREGLPGRTAEVYRINPAAAYAGALDVTPDRIEARIADLTGAVVGEHTLPTTRRRPAGELVERLGAALAGANPPDKLRRVVIGVQAAIDPATGRLGYAAAKDVPGWQIPDLVPTLSAGLGVPVDVENNVNLVALAEQAHGAARDSRDFVLLWADEGIGSAVVLGGRMHRGATGGAGEVGYMPTPGAPTAREAGRYANHGYQALTGGPAVLKLLRSYGVRGADFRQAVANAVRLAAGTGQRADDARAGLRDIAARLAVGLAAITSVIDPGLIVLTGGVVLPGGETLRELVEHELHALTIPRPRVRLSSVEGNPVLAGALDLALDTVREEVFGSTVRS
ncbi:ROK family transcriptional regulator [Nonomuraea wenchangensis]|uniref:Sugar kinase of the NBD/HSP70 family, may contain an N-terminal HTH domain n=3 Tax=Nonomuraea wenchangensis TaxID=568860 RepID=A0A1I0KB43_9ACTN|nr:ROK family transcriptional regulator [Nonomuraea wenchangensis]SEU21326.1 Sugar kinase of the NBD/HSP70 family, may contain an N-terminal HTH domain [Nonomuraea wenchangensis]